MYKKDILGSIFILICLFHNVNTIFCRTPEQEAFLKSLNLSQSETEWLEKDFVVKVHPDIWPPFNFWDYSEGKNKGICVEYVDWIKENTGIKFSFPTMQIPLGYALESLEKKAIDISPSLHKTKTREKYLNFTEPVIKESCCVYGLKTNRYVISALQKKGVRVSSEFKSKTYWFLKDNYPNMKIVPVPTEEDGLRKLKNGEVEYHIGISGVCRFLIKNRKDLSPIRDYEQLKDFSPEIYMAVRNDWPELASLIDKSLSKMAVETKIKIEKHYYNSINWSRYKNHFLVLLSFLSVVLTISTFWVIKLNKRLKAHKDKLQLSQTLLQEAKTQAEEANNAKSLFLAKVSHEIRTALSIISGLLDLLRHTDLTYKQKKYISKSTATNNFILDLIDEVLDFSKVETDRFSFYPQNFNLHLFIEDIRVFINDKIKGKNIQFMSTLDPDVPEWIVGDSRRLSQVLLNLLNNAIKNTYAGQIKLEVQSLSTNYPDKVGLKFIVSDTGTGIDEGLEDSIFSPFVQGESGNTRSTRNGVGLGLSICKKLVELWDGNIFYNSKVGEGTVFYFTYYGEPGKSQTTGINIEIEKNENIKFAKGLKILVVEDNAFIAEIAEEFLTDLNVGFDIVNDGETAIKHILKYPYHLAFVDINLPAMDGLSVSRKIRKEHNIHDLVIIALSADVLAYDSKMCLHAGMNDFLTKPFTKNDIVTMLVKWVPEYCDEVLPKMHKETNAIQLNSCVKEFMSRNNMDGSVIDKYFSDSYEKYLDHLFSFRISLQKKVERFEKLRPEEVHTLQKIVHNLKGEAAFLGLTELIASCKDVGNNTKTESLSYIVDVAKKHDRIIQKLEGLV